MIKRLTGKKRCSLQWSKRKYSSSKKRNAGSRIHKYILQPPSLLMAPGLCVEASLGELVLRVSATLFAANTDPSLVADGSVLQESLLEPIGALFRGFGCAFARGCGFQGCIRGFRLCHLFCCDFGCTKLWLARKGNQTLDDCHA